eukprot:scaffold9114_cov118-Isochrysis_galbana.AAC.17
MGHGGTRCSLAREGMHAQRRARGDAFVPRNENLVRRRARKGGGCAFKVLSCVVTSTPSQLDRAPQPALLGCR